MYGFSFECLYFLLDGDEGGGCVSVGLGGLCGGVSCGVLGSVVEGKLCGWFVD